MNEVENKKAAYDFYGKMPFRKAFPLDSSTCWPCSWEI